MLVKSSIALVLVITAAVGLSRIDYRGLYDEMYPVNGLKRDVLGLCSLAKPTFIRAVEEDRVNCYDNMPDNIDLAIGWVRTSDRLAALRKVMTPVDVAERLLAEETLPGRGMLGRAHFTGYVAAPIVGRPCVPSRLAAAAGSDSLALGETDAQLARHIARGSGGALAALGLVSRTEGSEQPQPTLPRGSLQRRGSGGGVSGGLIALPEPRPAAELGEDDTARATPGPTGCKTRA